MTDGIIKILLVIIATSAPADGKIWLPALRGYCVVSFDSKTLGGQFIIDLLKTPAQESVRYFMEDTITSLVASLIAEKQTSGTKIRCVLSHGTL